MIRLRRPLSLILFCLIAVPAAAGDLVVLDPAAAVALEKRWPRPLALIRRRLLDPSGASVRDRPAVASALNAAAAFVEADGLPEAARVDAKAAAARGLRAGLDALGPDGGLFLGRDGGLGEIAREILGAEASGLLSKRAEALYHAGRYQEAAAAARQAWELSGRRDTDAHTILKFAEGRAAATRSANGSGPHSAKTATAGPGAQSAEGRPSIPAVRAPNPAVRASKQAPSIVPGVSAPGQERADDRVASLSDLELEESAYNALREAVSAAPMPVFAARSAFDRPPAVVERDLKLRRAAQAAGDWLSRSPDPQARALLESLGDSRRAVLGEALSRASILMDRSASGREDARVRSVLMGDAAAPEVRAEAAQALLAMRRQDPAYFKAKAAALDFVRFNREHLADFPAKTRLSGAELGLEPPPDSGLASIEYETTKDGRLVAARLVSADGSSRERAEAAGAWTVRDKSGAVAGWTLDAGAFAAMADDKARAESVAAAARWLFSQGFRPGGSGEQADAAASVLGDLLGRDDADVKGLQVYADRAEGRLVMDAYHAHGVKQKVVRFEPGEAGQAAALALYERAVADPSDATTPWRKAMLYRGAGERELLTAKAVSNGDALSRAVTGTTVELVPVAVGYRRGADGRWTRDGRTREFPEQRRVIHDSAGVIGGSGEVLGVAGRGATDLAACALAAGGALSLYPARAVPRVGGLAAEVQRDWFERAGVNLVDNALSAELGERYLGDAYKDRRTAMSLDRRKYVQNVRRELTEQGHPLLGAVAGAGVGVANGMAPMAAGFAVISGAARLGFAGEMAAAGVGYIWAGQAALSAGISVQGAVQAWRSYDERDPLSVAAYYSAVEDLAEQTLSASVLLVAVKQSRNVRAGAPPGRGAAAPKDSAGMSAEPVEGGGLNLFKWGKKGEGTTDRSDGWKIGDHMLYLKNQGSPKRNWVQNARQLRIAMQQRKPIYDSLRHPQTGAQEAADGFLRAERMFFASRGWTYDPSIGAFVPPPIEGGSGR